MATLRRLDPQRSSPGILQGYSRSAKPSSKTGIRATGHGGKGTPLLRLIFHQVCPEIFLVIVREDRNDHGILSHFVLDLKSFQEVRSRVRPTFSRSWASVSM